MWENSNLTGNFVHKYIAPLIFHLKLFKLDIIVVLVTLSFIKLY